MTIPIIAGMPLHVWLGILTFILILVQVGIGKRWIKVPFIWHRVLGFVIVILALIHGLIGFGLYNGFLSFY